MNIFWILVNLFACTQFVACRDFYLGMFRRNDFLVAQDVIYKARSPFGYTTASYGRVFKCPITYFRVVDRLGTGRGPFTTIVRGGLRKKFINVRIKSTYRLPISVNIYVGCENKQPTRVKLTTHKPSTTTPKPSKKTTHAPITAEPGPESNPELNSESISETDSETISATTTEMNSETTTEESSDITTEMNSETTTEESSDITTEMNSETTTEEISEITTETASQATPVTESETTTVETTTVETTTVETTTVETIAKPEPES